MKKSFSCIFAFVALTAATVGLHAQEAISAADSNLLWSLTGPNVLPARGLQWSNSLNWTFSNMDQHNVNENLFAGQSVLR